MLKLIYGSFGSGKTYCLDTLILDALKLGKEAVLLVPEQEVMEAERRLADRADTAGVHCEKLTVVSFRRLANLAFRKYGGIEYKYLDEGGKLLLIWRILEELSPVLSAYGKSRDVALTELMLSICEELKRYSVPPSALSRLSDTLSPSLLKDKLSDISLVYSAFTAETKEEYSDAADDVTRLAEILKTESFFDGKLLFLDSFNGFTVPEIRVLEHAITQCDVTVTLGLPEERGLTAFKTLEDTEKTLIDTAKKHNVQVYTSARLYPLEKYIPEEFRLISERLWDFSYSPTADKASDEAGTEEAGAIKTGYPLSSDRITLAEAGDPFMEAEFIAIKICELIRSGERYRDIAIASRNTAVYDGIFDVVFKKYGIPFFFSHRTGITSTAIFRTVKSALDVISGGWKTNDVLSYIKTGICGFSAAETDILESYAIKWSISGRRWTDEYEWNMNPSGYTDRLTEDGKRTLAEVNRLRLKLREPLIKLRDSVRNVPLRDAAAAVFSFISECGIYERCRISKNAEDVTVYNTFISLLETMVNVAGDVPVNASLLSSLLTMTGKKVDYGSIPDSMDCVKAGDAAIMRLHGIRHVFLTSCESGVFPKSVEDSSVFSDDEKEVLKSGGIQLSPDTATKNDEEMFCFLRCACSAVSSLTLTYTLLDGKPYPSVGLTRVSALFPLNKVISYPNDVPLLNRIQNASAAKDIALGAYGTPLFETLKKLYGEKGEAPFLSGMPLSSPDVTVSADITETLYKKEFTLSQSKIESFSKCPFSYYCKHVLGLQEKKRAEFLSSDKGSYIHRILEKVIAVLFSDDEKRKNITDGELKALIDNVVKEILGGIFGSLTELNARFGALISRLNRTVFLLVKNILKEFENSDFTPKFFELNIGKGEKGTFPFKVNLSDGTKLKINGIVDRVDTYEKDGDVFVRVVDYKTGTREHSLKNIKLGLDMQMLLYLFSLCKDEAVAFKRSLGISEDGKIHPAGVLYQPSYVPTMSVENDKTPEQALSLFEKKLTRFGILLEDPEILDAMEHGLSGNFIPVTVKKDALSVSKGELKTLEEFGKLMSEVTDILTKIGERLKHGEASATPLKTPAIDACQYCEMRVVCRNQQ